MIQNRFKETEKERKCLIPPLFVGMTGLGMELDAIIVQAEEAGEDTSWKDGPGVLFFPLIWIQDFGSGDNSVSVCLVGMRNSLTDVEGWL